MAAKDTDDRKSDDQDNEGVLDMSQAAVKKMIADAREKGYITYDQLNRVLPPDQVSSEQIEDVMSMLSEMGINIIEDEEAEDEGEEGKGSTEVVETSTSREVAVAQTETGFKVWYQDGFVRDINPNPYGRVFSASGDELVANDLGRTLSYVKKDKIISETRTKPRGEILESFHASPDRTKLFVTIKVDRPDWSRIVEIKQVYKRVASSDDDAPESGLLKSDAE